MKSVFNETRSRSGQTTAYMAIVMLVIVMLAAFAIDMGLVNLTRARQADMLQQSLEKCLEPATSLKVKNSEDPGRELCGRLAGFLRDGGYDGAVTAYYYELDPSEGGLPDNYRVYAFGATLEASTDMVLGHLYGTDAATTRVQAFSAGVAYASDKIYRPASAGCGKYAVEAGASAGHWTPASSLPELGDSQAASCLQQELADAVKETRQP